MGCVDNDRAVLKPTHIDRLVAEYLASDTIARRFAADHDVPYTTFHRWLRDRGHHADRGHPTDSSEPSGHLDRLPRPDLEVLQSKFDGGTSVNALAKEYGVSRQAVNRWLGLAGASTRDRSAAMRVRWDGMTAEDRRKLTVAAQAAAKGRQASAEERNRRAQTVSAYEGWWGLGEDVVVEALVAAGPDVIRQHPVGPYNIDIAVGSVAVEVHRRTTHPGRASINKSRTAYLNEQGWRVLYVWCAPGARGGNWCITPDALNRIVEHTQRATNSPDAVPALRVLRCTGIDA
jgi:transposase-like protein